MTKSYRISCFGWCVWYRLVDDPIPFDGETFKTKEAARKALKENGWWYDKVEHVWQRGYHDWAEIKEVVEDV